MFQWFLPAKEQKKIYNEPTMLYFANSSVGTASLPPRMMHAHDERLKITFVSGGSGTYLVDNQKYKVKKGDIIVIEPTRIHDEKKDANSELTVFCLGITGIRLPGMRRNQILPDNAVPVLHPDSLEPHIQNIMMCMFEQLLLKQPKRHCVSVRT